MRQKSSLLQRQKNLRQPQDEMSNPGIPSKAGESAAAQDEVSMPEIPSEVGAGAFVPTEENCRDIEELVKILNDPAARNCNCS